MTLKPSRSEQAIFADLAALCTRPGYIHALAFLCSRDNIVPYINTVTESDLQKMSDPSRLSRTEMTTLLGLAVKTAMSWDIPSREALAQYVASSDQLLAELHEGMSRSAFADFSPESIAAGINPLESGSAMREAIFYAGESAYSFQYLDFAVRKYSADAAWLTANRGFTIEDARAVVVAIDRVISDRFADVVDALSAKPEAEWTHLPLYAFTVEALAVKSGMAPEIVERVLGAFTLPSGPRNRDFMALNDFNEISATPLLRMPSGEYVSLQPYGLAEALYDSPFYWMVQDKAYAPSLMKRRGEFTERFATERLQSVFGKNRVYANVEIGESKGTTIGEIDTLVVWGDRAIIVQAKSKRLTLDARKGNDQTIREDFQKGVQSAYDQAVRCAQCLGENRFTLTPADGRNVVFPYPLKEIYVFCVVSDNYPALTYQTGQYLQTQTIPRVQPPMVMDVFTLDAMTEMLQSPLQFLSFINRRVNYSDRLLAAGELTILAYHLKHNLWIDASVGLLHLAEDFTASLDLAMSVRRIGIAGASTPDGILTRLDRTRIGRIVQTIERRPEPPTIELGFMLLTLSGEAVNEASRAIDALAARARADGEHHDFSMPLRAAATGLTVHLNDDPDRQAAARLRSHVSRRKYKQKADRWFGICMSTIGPEVRFGVSLEGAWEKSEVMDAATRDLPAPMPFKAGIAALLEGKGRRPKVGRNDRCPCGSGLKYKKCCLRPS